MPGRKHARRERAKARAEGRPVPVTPPTVADIKFRCGATNRDVLTGVGRIARK